MSCGETKFISSLHQKGKGVRSMGGKWRRQISGFNINQRYQVCTGMFHRGTNYCSYCNQSGVSSNLCVCRNLCYKLTLIDVITSFLSTYIYIYSVVYIYLQD